MIFYRGYEIESEPKSIFGISYQGSVCYRDLSKRIIILQWQNDKNINQNSYILGNIHKPRVQLRGVI